MVSAKRKPKRRTDDDLARVLHQAFAGVEQGKTSPSAIGRDMGIGSSTIHELHSRWKSRGRTPGALMPRPRTPVPTPERILISNQIAEASLRLGDLATNFDVHDEVVRMRGGDPGPRSLVAMITKHTSGRAKLGGIRAIPAGKRKTGDNNLRIPNPRVAEPLDPSHAQMAIAANAATAYAYASGTMPEEHLGAAWLGALAGVNGTGPEWKTYSRMRVDNELHVTARAMREIIAQDDDVDDGRRYDGEDAHAHCLTGAAGEVSHEELVALIEMMPERGANITRSMIENGRRTMRSVGSDLGLTHQRVEQILRRSAAAALAAARPNDIEPSAATGAWRLIEAGSCKTPVDAVNALSAVGALTKDAFVEARGIGRKGDGIVHVTTTRSFRISRKGIHAKIESLWRGKVQLTHVLTRETLDRIGAIVDEAHPTLAWTGPCPPEAFAYRQGDGVTWTRERQERDRQNRADQANLLLEDRGHTPDARDRVVDVTTRVANAMLTARPAPARPAARPKPPENAPQRRKARRTQNRAAGQRKPQAGGRTRRPIPATGTRPCPSRPETVVVQTDSQSRYVVVDGVTYRPGRAFPTDTGGIAEGATVLARVDGGMFRIHTPAGSRFWLAEGEERARNTGS